MGNTTNISINVDTSAVDEATEKVKAVADQVDRLADSVPELMDSLVESTCKAGEMLEKAKALAAEVERLAAMGLPIEVIVSKIAGQEAGRCGLNPLCSLDQGHDGICTRYTYT